MEGSEYDHRSKTFEKMGKHGIQRQSAMAGHVEGECIIGGEKQGIWVQTNATDKFAGAKVRALV